MIIRFNQLLRKFLFVTLGSFLISSALSAAHAAPPAQQDERTQASVGTNPAPYPPLLSPGDSIPIGKQYPVEDLENLRLKLTDLLNTVQEYSDLVLPYDLQLASTLEIAKQGIEQYGLEQLNAFRAALNPDEIRLGQARAALKESRPLFESLHQGSGLMSAGLPGREAPTATCDALVGSGRPSEALIIGADATYIAAAVVKVGLSRACEQVAVAVILGEGGGGNTSLACVVSDGVFLAAQAVRDKISSCTTLYTARSVDANFNRLAHLNTDIEGSVANDNSNKTTIVNNDNTNKNTIVNNDNSNKSTIVSNDNTNKAVIVSNDNTNKNTIVTNDDTNTSTILAAISASQNAVVANTNAGKNELRDLILRTQIEAALSADHHDLPVGVYVMPAADGGYLELVREIVIDTITKLAGKHTDKANKHILHGDDAMAVGNYKKAFEEYNKAYKDAMKK